MITGKEAAIIKALLEKGVSEATKNEESWQAFLTASAWNYTARPHNKLLLFAQAPTARAVLSENNWEQLNRSVLNREQYVYQLTGDALQKSYAAENTIGTENAPFTYWKIPFALNETQLMHQIDQAAEALPPGIIEELHEATEPYVASFSREEIKSCLLPLVKACVQYQIYTRCELPVPEEIENGVELLPEFAEFSSFLAVNDAISSVAQPLLKEIAREARLYVHNPKEIQEKENSLLTTEAATKKQKSATERVLEELKASVKAVFQSGAFQEYLDVLARFHTYSVNNTLLIHHQMPKATLVAGLKAWNNKFHRHVKKGEKGIKILAPIAPKTMTREEPVIDEATGTPKLDEYGEEITETKTYQQYQSTRFRLVSVFDVSQTEGEPLQMFATDLTDDVLNYSDYEAVLREISPVPIVWEQMPDDGYKGYFSSTEQKIAISPSLSQAQTLKTMVHEIVHATLHDTTKDESNKQMDVSLKEVQAEATAYVVLRHFGIDTSNYSFGYIASYSSREVEELQASLAVIQSTAKTLITQMEQGLEAIRREQEQARELLEEDEVKLSEEEQLIAPIPAIDESQQAQAEQPPTENLTTGQTRSDSDSSVFVYHGYHFKPIGQMPEFYDFHTASRYTKSDTNFAVNQANRYSYNGFYASATEKEYDIFQCLENETLYIPVQHELMIWTGDIVYPASEIQPSAEITQEEVQQEEQPEKTENLTTGQNPKQAESVQEKTELEPTPPAQDLTTGQKTEKVIEVAEPAIEQSSEESPTLTTVEQLTFVGAEESFSLPTIPSSAIDAVLHLGTIIVNSRFRIYRAFTSNSQTRFLADFLKKEYGYSGATFIVEYQNLVYGYQSDASGLTIQQRSKESTLARQETHLTWSQAASRVQALIEQGDYFTIKEQKDYEAWLAEQKKESAPITLEPRQMPLPEENLTTGQKAGSSEPVAYGVDQGSMEDFSRLRKENPKDIIFYQVGDFFELYGPDARVASTLLDLHLATRHTPDHGTVTMCGFPKYKLNEYRDKIRKQHSVTVSSIDSKSGNRVVYHMIQERQHLQQAENLTSGQNQEAEQRSITEEQQRLIGQKLEYGGYTYRIDTVQYESGENEPIVYCISESSNHTYRMPFSAFLRSMPPAAQLLQQTAAKEPINETKQEQGQEENLTTGQNEQTQAEVQETTPAYSDLKFTLQWTEHPIQTVIDPKTGKPFFTENASYSFAFANRLLGLLDMTRNRDSNGGYHKTSFLLTYRYGEEECSYEGRYDLGDGETDLVTHIHNFLSYQAEDKGGMVKAATQSEKEYAEKIAYYKEMTDEFVPFLQQNTELTREEQEKLDRIAKLEREWNEFYVDEERILTEEEQQLIGQQVQYGGNPYIVEDVRYVEDNEEPTVFLVDEAETNHRSFPLSVFWRSNPFANRQSKQEQTENLTTGQIPEEAEEIAQEQAEPEPTPPVQNLTTGQNTAPTTTLRPNGKPFYFVQKGDVVTLSFGSEQAYTIDHIESNRYYLSSGTSTLMQYEESLQNNMAECREANQRYITPREKEELPEENFRLDMKKEMLDDSSTKEKIENNLLAIETLKAIERENRGATLEEKEILSRYIGWGGFPQVFDQHLSNGYYEEYRKRLQELVTEEEYSAMEESVLTAFYTPAPVISAIYRGLEEMNLPISHILEPSCGVGKFIGCLPESLHDSKVHGVELDPLTGKIASLLYPQASITIDDFQNVKLQNDFFDVAIGNVPFGNFGMSDPLYKNPKMLIHDYFFAKSLDKVRAGGALAFITSTGTMDKQSSKVREYLAQRVELLGAVRLPSNTFSDTKTSVDILFLQKRAEKIENPNVNWLHLAKDENDLCYNEYFHQNPNMVLGGIAKVSGPYGPAITCYATSSRTDLLHSLLPKAIAEIAGNAKKMEHLVQSAEESPFLETGGIEADTSIPPHSYGYKNGHFYYRENDKMHKVEFSKTATPKIIMLLELRDAVTKLIRLQTYGATEEKLETALKQANDCYDSFYKKYKSIATAAKLIKDDDRYPLLTSLEKYDSTGAYLGKADIFRKYTVKRGITADTAATPSDALALSLHEHGKVDLAYMEQLLAEKSITREEIVKDLLEQRAVYYDFGIDSNLMPRSITDFPLVTTDEYLSGNVRRKLETVHALKAYLPQDQQELINTHITALEEVQPETVEIADIEVKLGATWIPESVIAEFTSTLLEVPYNPNANDRYKKFTIHYSKAINEWEVKPNLGYYEYTTLVTDTYGTTRMDAFQILANTLNQRNITIKDKVVDEITGKESYVTNQEDTVAARQRQDRIRQKWREWIMETPERREYFTTKYNFLFNAFKSREYDGSHLLFPGMNQQIALRTHQTNAVARMLYGGNTLLAHEVGAGKTFAMIAAAQESKRIGLSKKSLFVVPKHLTQQWGKEYLRLYPNANVLITKEGDFEKSNRRRLLSRIATGDYDAVIISHEQFSKIPLSNVRQMQYIHGELNELQAAINENSGEKSQRTSFKKAKTRYKRLQKKLELLQAREQKDEQVLTFEQMGIDRLFVDESHAFKNLFFQTKLSSVAGVSTSHSQKATDMHMKCRYLNEVTGEKGICFATGTPISNSMVEMYTLHRYLQENMLDELGLSDFDSWASIYGKTGVVLELDTTGKAFRAKERFSKFTNLPELMQFFREVADIQTAKMMQLEVPEVEEITISSDPTADQKKMVQNICSRVEAIRQGYVDPHEDNMLNITNDGRKLALDQRLMNPSLPDDPESKVSKCSDKVYEIWEQTKDTRGTQIVFCDISTPKEKERTFDGEKETANLLDNSFLSVYETVRDKLIAKGIPKEEIAFVHDASTSLQREALFEQVRKGEIRVLLGSTQKMGTGTNVQDKLVAMHDLDCPWRPSDLEQRRGRIVRQGNENDKVSIYRYVTKETYDSVLWQIVENKQRYISQVMTAEKPPRSMEDVDDATLSYATIKAIATGNEKIKEYVSLEEEIKLLSLLQNEYTNTHCRLDSQVKKDIPEKIAKAEDMITRLKQDEKTCASPLSAIQKSIQSQDPTNYGVMEIDGVRYSDHKEAGKAIFQLCSRLNPANLDTDKKTVRGSYCGLSLSFYRDVFQGQTLLYCDLKGAATHEVSLGTNTDQYAYHLFSKMRKIPEVIAGKENAVKKLGEQLELAKQELQKPFEKKLELEEKQARFLQLKLELETGENPELAEATIGGEEDTMKQAEQDVSEQQPSKETEEKITQAEEQKQEPVRDDRMSVALDR